MFEVLVRKVRFFATRFLIQLSTEKTHNGNVTFLYNSKEFLLIKNNDINTSLRKQKILFSF